MITLTNHEIVEAIDTVIFRLNQTRREDILAIPHFIRISQNKESFYGKNYEIITAGILCNRIIAHLQFDGLSEVTVLKIDLDDLKVSKNTFYGSVNNRIIDLFNKFVQDQPKINSASA